MRSLAELNVLLESMPDDSGPRANAEVLLAIGEEVLEHWVRARDEEPTDDTREGFRLLALHRQGARNDASFNACRETCRELAYYYNLITMQPDHTETTDRTAMMKMICSHLYLFISGKMQVAELGDFCCSSRPVRQGANRDHVKTEEA